MQTLLALCPGVIDGRPITIPQPEALDWVHDLNSQQLPLGVL